MEATNEVQDLSFINNLPTIFITLIPFSPFIAMICVLVFSTKKYRYFLHNDLVNETVQKNRAKLVYAFMGIGAITSLLYIAFLLIWHFAFDNTQFYQVYFFSSVIGFDIFCAFYVIGLIAMVIQFSKTKITHTYDYAKIEEYYNKHHFTFSTEGLNLWVRNAWTGEVEQEDRNPIEYWKKSKDSKTFWFGASKNKNFFIINLILCNTDRFSFPYEYSQENKISAVASLVLNQMVEDKLFDNFFDALSYFKKHFY